LRGENHERGTQRNRPSTILNKVVVTANGARDFLLEKDCLVSLDRTDREGRARQRQPADPTTPATIAVRTAERRRPQTDRIIVNSILNRVRAWTACG
jgi:hypothetical protein